MAVNFTNNNFRGTIEGENAYLCYKKIIKTKRCGYKEAISKMNEILGTEIINGKEFYNDFWTKVFLQNDEDEYNGGIKLILNKTDSLYSESNIASVLEIMGTTIIRGELKKDNPDKFIRVFHTKEMFDKACKEYDEMKRIANSTSEGKYAINKGLDDLFVLGNQMNYKKEKRYTELDDKHLELLDNEYGSKYPAVHDYYVAYHNLKDKLNKYKKIKDTRELTKEEKIIFKLLCKHIKTTKDDFIECINKKARPIVFKVPLPDEGNPDWEMFDDLNKNHIRWALHITKGNDLQDDLSCIIRDLENTISKCEFTEMQYNVLKLSRKDKTQTDIGATLGIDQTTVGGHINAIVNKIYNKNLDKYESWYYLNICKGKYKKCSRCHEVKLINKFGINTRRKDGYETFCKECRK